MTLAMSDSYSSIKDRLCLDSLAKCVETLSIDPALAGLIDETEVISPTGLAAAAGASAYPVYSIRQGAIQGALQSPAYLVGIMTDGIAILKCGAGAVIAAGDLVAADALRTIVPAVAGDLTIGEALDTTDGSGTLAVPEYVRVRIFKMVAP